MCKPSPATNYLKNHGYNIVRQPREDIRVLDLFEGDAGRLLPLNCSLGEILKPDISGKLPDPEIDETVAGINGEATREVERSLGIQLLASLWPPYKGKLDAAYDNAHMLRFRFEGVKRDGINIARLEWVTEDFRQEEMAHGMRGRALNRRLFLITSRLKSATISVKAIDHRGATINVGLDAIGVGDAHISAKSNSDHAEEIIYQGAKELVFAVEARRFVFINGKLRQFKREDGKLIAYGANLRPPTNENGPPINEDGQVDEPSLLLDLAEGSPPSDEDT